MTLAVPNKGRLVEPTLHLLHDAGLVFEERDRSLVSRVENVDLDILFVRTNDVVEFVRDAVADLGITGGDLLAESEVDLPRGRGPSATVAAGSRPPSRRTPRSARSRSSPACGSRPRTRARRAAGSPSGPSTSR